MWRHGRFQEAATIGSSSPDRRPVSRSADGSVLHDQPAASCKQARRRASAIRWHQLLRPALAVGTPAANARPPPAWRHRRRSRTRAAASTRRLKTRPPCEQDGDGAPRPGARAVLQLGPPDRRHHIDLGGAVARVRRSRPLAQAALQDQATPAGGSGLMAQVERHLDLVVDEPIVAPLDHQAQHAQLIRAELAAGRSPGRPTRRGWSPSLGCGAGDRRTARSGRSRPGLRRHPVAMPGRVRIRV